MLLADDGQGGAARAPLAAALAGLTGADLPEVRAELHLRLGSVAQEQATGGADARSLLHEAIDHYYDGLKLVSEESAPVLWASLTMNPPPAHLAVPMTQASDQLRLGVATQALRACRRVFTPESAPVPWSTATLNLANALVYTPSTHQGYNPVEAVESRRGARPVDGIPWTGLAAHQSRQVIAPPTSAPSDAARAKLVEARSFSGAPRPRQRGDGARHPGRDRQGPGDRSRRGAADLARQAEQMARCRSPTRPTPAGMGVTGYFAAGLDAGWRPGRPEAGKGHRGRPATRPTDDPGTP
ncbi:MAG: hypothetical protein R2734_08580 [Nocardioides sp.]